MRGHLLAARQLADAVRRTWWPIVLASSAALGMLGLAVGSWIFPIGLAVFVVAIVGWVYEYYRGYFAR